MRQTASLGREAQAVREGLSRIRAERCLPRLWDRDATLWSADEVVQRAIRNRLGWLSIAGVMAQQADVFQRFAQEIRDAGFGRILLLGMGGSGLFSEVCRLTFGAAPGHPDLAVLDSTDPTAIRTQQARGALQQLLVIVSSKSGATSESAALSQYFYEAFQSINGEPGAHCVAITDAGTPLEAQATSLRFRRVFTHGPGTGAEVGGRFSALTAFGLVPAALIGVDVGRLLARVEEMLARCGPGASLEDNPAALLGSALATLTQAGRDKLTLLCPPSLESFGTWVEQLVAESVGKMGKGVVPIHGEDLREPRAYGTDRFFVELQLEPERDDTVDRHVRALIDAGHPVIRIAWRDRYDMGGEVAKWAVATAIAGGLMGINPFDEPNVQESKDRTKALLAGYVKQGRFPSEPPLLSDGDAVIFGSVPALDGQSLASCLAAFFRQLAPEDYIALLSFLPRTPALDDGLAALRRHIAERTPHATMLGIGPRYLHSTGQLYKGGPDRGLFLFFTADERQDLPIPGEPFTFGALKQAQALGDVQAMQSRGRRVLRIHLGGDLEAGLARVTGAVVEALAGAVRR